MKSRCFILYIISVLFLSCSNSKKEEPSQPTETISATPNIAASTKEMAGMLRKIESRLGPDNSTYVNNKIVGQLQQKEQTAQQSNDVANFLDAKFSKAHNLLYAGRTEEAIKEFEFIIQFLKDNKLGVEANMQQDLERKLGLCYLRKAEQDNCIRNHTSQSCIIPIGPKGIHQNKQGSEAAILYFNEYLKKYPDDATAKWLLNIAHMTLGQYPEKVPAAYRVSQDKFNSDRPFKTFNDVAPGLGLDVNQLSGGVIVEDFDRDGDLDIMTSSWNLKHQVQLFINNNDGSFSNKTESSGITGITGGLNMTHADVNNDGYEDVLILRGAWLGAGTHPNSLLRNNGDGTFDDITFQAGLNSLRPTQTAAFADFNNDGWIDLFIGNESYKNIKHQSELYVNKGDGTFVEAGAKYGLNVTGLIKGAAWGDINNDGNMDLFISNMSGPNLLFKNSGPDANGEYQFEEIGSSANIQAPKESFASWFCDYNQDGWLDIFVCGYAISEYNKFAENVFLHYSGKKFKGSTGHLYENKKNGTFQDVTKKVKLDKPGFTMGANFGDLDNDGYCEFYLGTGEPDFQAVIPNKMYRNNGGKYFEDITTAGGFGHIQKGHAIAFNDLDNDGDQDIYAVMGGAYEGDVYQNILYENPGFDNNWIKLKLEGSKANKSAIGARVEVEVTSPSGKRKIHDAITSGSSFGSSAHIREIGIGKATEIESVKVIWPGEKTEKSYGGFSINSSYKIIQDQPTPEKLIIKGSNFKMAEGAHHHHHDH